MENNEATSCSAPAQPEQPTPRINMAMLTELDQRDSVDIIDELQRRLGLPNLEETGVPLDMLDEDLKALVDKTTGPEVIGVPEPWISSH